MSGRFRDRREAGRLLAERLRTDGDGSDTVVLALPRGGVPVAAEIAHELAVPLDVFVVRKLGVPGHEELAMGATTGRRASGRATASSRVADQFDAVIHVDQIRAVEPLERTARSEEGEVPETYSFGV
jgi:putative phosphoribosyl transferase